MFPVNGLWFLAQFSYFICGSILWKHLHTLVSFSVPLLTIFIVIHSVTFTYQVLCPVCREPLTYDQAQLQKHPEQNDLDPCSIIISQEVRLIQKKMAALFKKQQFKGGIIDLQAEKDRYLVPSVSEFILLINLIIDLVH